MCLGQEQHKALRYTQRAVQQVLLKKMHCCGCTPEDQGVLVLVWQVHVRNYWGHSSWAPHLRTSCCCATAWSHCAASLSLQNYFPPASETHPLGSELWCCPHLQAGSTGWRTGTKRTGPALLWSLSMHALQNHASYWGDQSRRKQTQWAELPAWLMGILKLFHPQQKSCGALCPRTHRWDALSFSEYFSSQSTHPRVYSIEILMIISYCCSAGLTSLKT